MVRSGGIVLALLVLAATLAGCRQEDDQFVTIENRTGVAVQVFVDGNPYVVNNKPIAPGESMRVGDRGRYWPRPRSVVARDAEGNVRFEQVLSWEDLQARNFRLVLE